MDDTLKELFGHFNNFDILKHTELLGYIGSVAHGTFIPSSDPNSIDDKDLMGIVLPPIDYLIGIRKFDNFRKQYFYWNIVMHELRKYSNLLLKGNPNVLTLLYLPEHLYIKVTEIGELLIENRTLFLGKENIFRAFIGYGKNKLDFIQKKAYRGYMGEKRKRLVDKFGYDVKDASHFIMLMRQGCELLETGELNVFRSDADYLKEIKTGKYTLEYIQQEAAELFCKMETKYKESELPDHPDNSGAEKLLREILLSKIIGTSW